MAPFLSPAWFDLAGELTADLPRRDDLGYAVQFEAGDAEGAETWHQVVEDGRVTAWAAGPLDAPELVLRWSPGDAVAIHRDRLADAPALAATTVVAPGPDGRVRAERPSPLDIEHTDELARLPLVPGVTFTVQYRFDHGPFGPVDYWWSFDEGRSAGMGLGRADDADLQVGITFARMVAVRDGRITILEALEGGGTVAGEIGPLMLLGGMQESPELHAAELACGPSGAVLAAMGELRAQPAYAGAWSTLAAATT